MSIGRMLRAKKDFYFPSSDIQGHTQHNFVLVSCFFMHVHIGRAYVEDVDIVFLLQCNAKQMTRAHKPFASFKQVAYHPRHPTIKKRNQHIIFL